MLNLQCKNYNKTAFGRSLSSKFSTDKAHRSSSGILAEGWPHPAHLCGRYMSPGPSQEQMSMCVVNQPHLFCVLAHCQHWSINSRHALLVITSVNLSTTTTACTAQRKLHLSCCYQLDHIAFTNSKIIYFTACQNHPSCTCSRHSPDLATGIHDLYITTQNSN